MRGLAVRIFEDAVREMRPDHLIAGGRWTRECSRPVEAYRRILVIAIGKGAIAFVHAIEAQLGDRISAGIAVVPRGYSAALPPDLSLPTRVRLMEAGHPVPDSAGLQASRAVLSLAGGAGAEDLVLVCVSGGGSALLPAPSVGVSMRDVVRLTGLLLRSGAPIGEVNTVRRAISRIAGGGLARIAAPAEVIGLVLSDVPGDDPADVAGGPLSVPPTSAKDALEVLGRYGIDVPSTVLRCLRNARPAATPDASVYVVGTNSALVRAAADAARRLGVEVEAHEDPLTGEARQEGPRIIHEALQGAPVHILGGETTVRVTGEGKGGRNQELALAAAIELESVDRPMVLLAAGSDGVDGPTAAAGAVCDRLTVATGRRLGANALRHLAANDSWGFFDRVGGLVVTGPTHTNVMDLVVVARSDDG